MSDLAPIQWPVDALANTAAAPEPGPLPARPAWLVEEAWLLQPPRADERSHVLRDEAGLLLTGSSSASRGGTAPSTSRSGRGSPRSARATAPAHARAEGPRPLHGVHAGYVRVSGRAPDALTWELGRGWDGKPLEVFEPAPVH